MRILLAPDKFKSCLTATEVADAMAEGVVAAGAQPDCCPLADGGEGTVDALVHATAGRFEYRWVTGPLGAKVRARFGILGDNHTAVIEMAAAAGLSLVPEPLRNPLHTTTHGVGELLRAAAQLGATQIILGIGGSATTDAGIGAAQGAGMEILTTDAKPLPTQPLRGQDLPRVQAIRPRGALQGVQILVACDVDNPLTGPNGAAPVFAPQKGASPAEVNWLDHQLLALARRCNAEPRAHHPGAGAAGGLGFAMLHFFNAKLVPGAELVMRATRFDDRLRNCDLVLTGEGRLDPSSLHGKTPLAVARQCRAARKPCILIAGDIDPSAAAAARSQGVTQLLSLSERAGTTDAAKQHARALIAAAARDVATTHHY